MADYLVTGPDGRQYRVSGPDGVPLQDVFKRFMAAQEPPAVGEGDWQGVADRLKAAESKAADAGPMNPATTAAVREEAARVEGERYGRARAATTGVGMIGEGIGRLADKAGLGLPRLAEAYMPGFLGGQSTLPGNEAHEFLKSADAGRATVNPKTALTGNISGALAQALIASPSVAMSVGGRLAQGVGVSSALGGAEAAVESRGNLGETAKGAGYGGLFGLLGGAAAEGAIAGGRALVDPLRGLAKSGPIEQQTAARLALEAKRAGLTSGDVANKVAGYGPDGMLADALGTQGATMARSAANLSPEARSILETASSARNAAQPERMMADLAQITGNPSRKTVAQIAGAIDDASRPKIDEAYNVARAAGYDLPRAPFADLLESPKVASAINQAVEQIKDRVAAFGGDQASQLAVYDAAKKILDRMGWKEGDELAKVLAAKLRQRVDQFIPEYGGARDLAAKVKRSTEGLDLGADIAKRAPGRDAPDMVKEALARGIPEGRIAQGYGAQRMEMLANKGASQVNLGLAPAEQEAAKAALGNRYSALLDTLARERDFSKLHKELTGNSSTARQLAQQMAGAGLATGGAGYLAGFDIPTSASIGAALAAGKRGLQGVSTAMKGKTEREVAEALAKALTGKAMPALVRTETTRRAIAEALLRTGGRAAALDNN